MAGIVAAIIHYAICIHLNGTAGAATQSLNFWRALTAFCSGSIVLIIVSLVTPAPKRDELEGLVYGQAAETIAHDALPWYQRPVVLGAIIIAITIIVNIIFW